MIRFLKVDFPFARKPETAASGVVRPCFQCAKPIRVSRWDDWNGFLVRCPYCKKPHGKNWNKKAIMWGSFFVNGFSFFFTMRPIKALICLVLLVTVAFAGIKVLDTEYLPQLVEVFAFFGFLITPMLINGGLIVVHERALGRSGETGTQQVASLLEELAALLT